MRAPLITTSWDDGHPLDLRVAELLALHGFKGTFYVPVRHEAFPVLDRAGIRALRDAGMEIGSHTVSHPELTGLPPKSIRCELRDSKKYLEDLLGEEVTSFCYPRGEFNRRLAAMVRHAGYTIGRTTVAFRVGRRFDPLRMPVSFQFAPHSRQIHIRHALKEGNLQGLLTWMVRFGMNCGLAALAARMSAAAAASNGILHIWGHSWEIDRWNLWKTLDEILRVLAATEAARACTNRGILAAI